MVDMGTLVFYPWLTLKKEYLIGDYRLIPYKRGELPVGDDPSIQDAIDKVTRPYLSEPRNPIVEATLLKIGSGSLIRNLSEAEREGVFEFSELLAISGLSSREFVISI
jgi:hypothetical protein